MDYRFEAIRVIGEITILVYTCKMLYELIVDQINAYDWYWHNHPFSITCTKGSAPTFSITKSTPPLNLDANQKLHEFKDQKTLFRKHFLSSLILIPVWNVVVSFIYPAVKYDSTASLIIAALFVINIGICFNYFILWIKMWFITIQLKRDIQKATANCEEVQE